MDKTKFTVNPHLDSEGFVMEDARCRGCGPDEPCPRSGHCERYSSPLRWGYAPWAVTLEPTARTRTVIELGADHGIYHGLRR
jgi:hypothetical protein